MFTPKLFQSNDYNLMKEIISENAFALLISSEDKLRATHSLMMLNEDNPDQIYLETHISSSWYEQVNVSTWNYEAVQIYGEIQIMNSDELYNHLEKLTYKYEKFQQCPMYVKNMGKEFVEKEMKGAFGMKIIPTEIYIKQKLSQNRKETDFENIISQLEKTDDQGKKIAKKMKLIKNKTL